MKSSRPRRCRSSPTEPRLSLANEYAPAADYKAFALNLTGINGFVSGQPSEEAAKNAALEQCQKRADAVQSPRKCELYAVGNTVVYPHGQPPVPPLPWIRRDPSIEKPFAAKDMPLIARSRQGQAREQLRAGQERARRSRVGPGGQFIFYTDGETTGEDRCAERLRACGALAGVPCMIVAIDDAFVVPVPTTMKVDRLLSRQPAIPRSRPDARDDVARKLAEASSGWNAVAVGASGRPGWRSRRPMNRMPSTKRWAIAPSATAIATLSRSARLRSGLN